MTFANRLLHDVIDLPSSRQLVGRECFFNQILLAAFLFLVFPALGCPGWASHAPQSTRLADAIDKPIT